MGLFNPQHATPQTTLPYSQLVPLAAGDRRPISPEVEARLQRFVASAQPGIWPQLPKAKIVAQMRSRLQNPFEANQGKQPFCGPASILFELLRHQPLRYIEICQALYERGFFQAGATTIAATERLRHSQGELGMAEADWLLMATWRDAENSIFRVDPSAPKFIQQLSGITKSWEMAGWAKTLLGYQRVRYHRAFLLGDVSALRRAERAVQQGGVAFLLVTADALLKPRALPVTVPNHWIVLLGDVAVQGQRRPWPWRSDRQLSFETYSWARRYGIQVPERAFEDLFWGVVIAQP